MTEDVKLVKKKEDLDTDNDSNPNLPLYSVAGTPGAGDSLGSNCPACGFPPNQVIKDDESAGICPECGHKLKKLVDGYFVIFRADQDHFDITHQWIPGTSHNKIPAEKKKLLDEIITTNIIIKSLYFSADTNYKKAEKTQNDEIKKKYFEKLLSIAQAGLTGTMARPELATLNLKRLKAEIITVEGQRIKNTYMRELGMRAFLSSLIALLLFFITTTAIFPDQATFADLLLKKPTSVVLFQSDFLAVISMCSIIWFGAMIGTWVSFAARNKAIDFEQLSILETDRLEPTIRLIYIGICAIIFALFLSSGIVALDVGGFSTADIVSSIGTQFVIGLLCGLTESKIGIFIHDKAESIIFDKDKDAAEAGEK